MVAARSRIATALAGPRPVRRRLRQRRPRRRARGRRPGDGTAHRLVAGGRGDPRSHRPRARAPPRGRDHGDERRRRERGLRAWAPAAWSTPRSGASSISWCEDVTPGRAVIDGLLRQAERAVDRGPGQHGPGRRAPLSLHRQPSRRTPATATRARPRRCRSRGRPPARSRRRPLRPRPLRARPRQQPPKATTAGGHDQGPGRDADRARPPDRLPRDAISAAGRLQPPAAAIELGGSATVGRARVLAAHDACARCGTPARVRRCRIALPARRRGRRWPAGTPWWSA